MIEIKRIPETDENPNGGEIYINGERLPIRPYELNVSKKENAFSLWVRGYEIIKKIIPYSLTEFPWYIGSLGLYLFPKELEPIDSIYITHIRDTVIENGKVDYKDRENEFSITFTVGDNLTYWDNQYTVRDYFNSLCREIEKEDNSDIEMALPIMSAKPPTL